MTVTYRDTAALLQELHERYAVAKAAQDFDALEGLQQQITNIEATVKAEAAARQNLDRAMAEAVTRFEAARGA